MRAPLFLLLLSGCYPYIPGHWTDYLDSDTASDPDVDTDTAGDCAPDQLEPNDSRSTAQSVAVPFSRELAACEGDDDWFTFPVAGVCEVRASIDFRSSDADLDLFLYEGASLVASTTSVADDQDVVHAVAGSADLYVQVSSTNGETTYGLSVTMSCEGQTGDCDAGEGVSVSPNGTVGGELCANDVDEYDVLPEPSPGCLVESQFSATGGEAIVSFLDDGREVGAGVLGSDVTLRSIVGEGLPSVHVDEWGDSISYTVANQTTCPSTPACPTGDVYDPNSQDDPVGLPWDTSVNAIVCDTDYYLLSGQSGCTGTVTANFIHANGDVDIAIMDISGNVLHVSNGSGDTETISYDARLPSLVYVEGYFNDTNEYELVTSLSCP